MIALQGPYPSNTERAFTLFEACLEQSEPGGCNEGLLRPDADLHLVGISDEPEQSEHAWDHYLPLFEGYLADHSKLVVHGVGADYPHGCTGASPYTGLYDAVQATGGEYFSICNPAWGEYLIALGEAVVDPPLPLSLSAQPVEETLELRVDGVSAERGWSYDARDNSVVFEPGVLPVWGSTVELRYAVAQGCSG